MPRHRDTLVLHASHEISPATGPLVPAIQLASTYVTPGEPAAHDLTYGRFHNPTWTAWEDALGALEGGHAISFASGMAAVSAVLGTCLAPGDILVLPDDSYYSIRRLADGWLTKIGIEVRLAPTRANAQATVLDGARLLWLETPSNPTLDICDIRQLADAAHARHVDVVVDNTTATPYLQQPLQLGADYVVASDTKALTGHSDLVLGHVATTGADRANAIRAWRAQHGAIPGPMEVWLAHRSLATLPLRLTRQCDSAQALAAFLQGHPAVTRVYYPGLSDHPAHGIARAQMTGYGGVVSFDLGTRVRAETFLRSLTLVREATSFGGVLSTAERRARWGGDAVGEGVIRFSVGCEAAQDLLADVEDALKAALE